VRGPPAKRDRREVQKRTSLRPAGSAERGGLGQKVHAPTLAVGASTSTSLGHREGDPLPLPIPGSNTHGGRVQRRTSLPERHGSRNRQQSVQRPSQPPPSWRGKGEQPGRRPPHDNRECKPGNPPGEKKNSPRDGQENTSGSRAAGGGTCRTGRRRRKN